MKAAALGLVLGLVLGLSACKTARSLEAEAPPRPRSEKFLLKKLLSQQVQAEWLSARLKVTWKDEYGVEKFTANLRWRRDSLLWMNFKKVSVEGGRALFRPDSIFIIDRMNQQYAVKDFAFLRRAYRFPFQFAELQTLLLGNPVFFTRHLEAGVEGGQYLLRGRSDRYEGRYYLDARDFRLQRMVLEDFRSGYRLDLKLEQYRQDDSGRNFSYFRSLQLESNDFGAAELKIQFSKVEFDVPKSIRFEIPEHYSRVE